MNSLTTQQLCAVLEVLPMELSFIDKDDNVRFWNKGASRGPAWQESCLDNPVQNCHQEKSRAAVNSVISKLRSGQKDVVDRMITGEGKTERLRWVAVRDEVGEYMGTLEIVQKGAEVAGLPA